MQKYWWQICKIKVLHSNSSYVFIFVSALSLFMYICRLMVRSMVWHYEIVCCCLHSFNFIVCVILKEGLAELVPAKLSLGMSMKMICFSGMWIIFIDMIVALVGFFLVCSRLEAPQCEVWISDPIYASPYCVSQAELLEAPAWWYGTLLKVESPGTDFGFGKWKLWGPLKLYIFWMLKVMITAWGRVSKDLWAIYGLPYTPCVIFMKIKIPMSLISLSLKKKNFTAHLKIDLLYVQAHLW